MLTILVFWDVTVYSGNRSCNYQPMQVKLLCSFKTSGYVKLPATQCNRRPEQKTRGFITCFSKYKAEVQSLYNHMRRSIQPLQKQSLPIHYSVFLSKAVVTQPVQKLINFMKPKHSSAFSQNHTLKQLNPDHTTTLYSFKTHF